MGGGVRPEQDPPVRAEVLHESARTRVTRLFFDGRTVIRKEPLGPDAPRRLQHELAILERLRSVAGVAQLVETPRYPGSIVMEDVDGTSLVGLSTPVDVDALVGLAVQLARAVAGMHRRAVMHRDIAPANVVISRTSAACLVDFALGMSLSEIWPEFTHHTQIVGTLAYLAPEQTGRTGRSVDQRADLYSFGATLYELATGAPPTKTPRQWPASASSNAVSSAATSSSRPTSRDGGSRRSGTSCAPTRCAARCAGASRSRSRS